MKIDSVYDSGNIEVVEIRDGEVDLRIRPDTNSEFLQWFDFRALEGKGATTTFNILNAGDAAYVGGWQDYRVCVERSDGQWRRVETKFADGVLSWTDSPHSGSVRYSYWAPYPHTRHLDLVRRMAAETGVEYRLLGRSVEGRSMDCLVLGSGPLNVWVIARQHPGESMAEWWMEGFLDHLVSDEATEALERMRFFVVPNMNPDGAFHGNLRSNAAGANLNREWNVATEERSPEVLCVRTAMEADPPSLCLDVHGDEALPYNFIAGAEGIAGHSDDQAAQLALFLDAYKAATPEFQTKHGYPKTAPGKANLGMCTNYCAHTFGGLAMTLEMPFKDNADRPDTEFGWSPQRAKTLGRDTLAPMLDWARSRDA